MKKMIYKLVCLGCVFHVPITVQCYVHCYVQCTGQVVHGRGNFLGKDDSPLVIYFVLFINGVYLISELHYMQSVGTAKFLSPAAAFNT